MRKTVDPLKPCYADTPAAALAALAVGAFARCDTPEMNRTAEAVTGKERSRGERAEFVLRSHALTEAALLWALDCWQTYATVCETTAIIAGLGADGKLPTGAIFLQGTMNAKLASLIDAQKEICRRSGMTFEDVANMASLSAMRARDEGAKPIKQLVDELTVQYSV